MFSLVWCFHSISSHIIVFRGKKTPITTVFILLPISYDVWKIRISCIFFTLILFFYNSKLHRHLFLSAFISLLCNTLYGVLGCVLSRHIAHILRFRHAFYKYKCALVSVGIFIHANLFSCKLITNHLGCMRTRRIAHIRYTRYFDPSTNKFYWIDNVTKVSKVKHRIKNIALYQWIWNDLNKYGIIEMYMMMWTCHCIKLRIVSLLIFYTVLIVGEVCSLRTLLSFQVSRLKMLKLFL